MDSIMLLEDASSCFIYGWRRCHSGGLTNPPKI